MPEVTQPVELRSQDSNPGLSEHKACVLATVLNSEHLFGVGLCAANRDSEENTHIPHFPQCLVKHSGLGKAWEATTEEEEGGDIATRPLPLQPPSEPGLCHWASNFHLTPTVLHCEFCLLFTFWPRKILCISQVPPTLGILPGPPSVSAQNASLGPGSVGGNGQALHT